MSKRNFGLFISSLALAPALLLSACGADDDGTAGQTGAEGDLNGKVVMLLPNTTTTRFVEHDGPGYVEAMKELAPGVEVELQNAEGDAATQLRQIETAVNAGVDAIVLVTADPNVSAAGLVRAGDAGIPVISYEHEALDGPVAYQLMSTPYAVGVVQAEYFVDHLPEGEQPLQIARLYGNAGDNYTEEVRRGQNDVLQGLIDDGTIEVVCEDNAQGWDPANAQRLTEQCLTKQQNNIDAVIASNDGTASGAIAALEGQALAGEIPVHGGLDANLEALRFILEGKQAMSAYRNFYDMGRTAAELTIEAMQGVEDSELAGATFDNGHAEIPTAEIEIHYVDADSMDQLVEAGIYSKEEICEGVTAEGYCTE